MHQDLKINNPLYSYILLMRLDRPTGFFLLLSPCLWGLAFAGATPLDDGYLYALFCLGAFFMRSAGCIINDVADRKLDAQVSRTAARPLASNAISLPSALMTLGILLGLSLIVLLQFNRATIILGFLSMGLVILYPLMKRITYWPQAFLGLTFNWGVLMGWTSMHHDLSWRPSLLYIAGIFWTLGYDTLYAVQDREDDLKVGIKSSAVKLGNHTLKWVVVFYGVMILTLLLLGLLENFGKWYYAVIAFVGIGLWNQLSNVDLKKPASCLEAFKKNTWVGFLVFIGILVA